MMMENDEAVLRVRDVRKSFNRVPVLKGVSLDVGRAQVLGLLGANGAGKSTLIKIVAGAHSAEGGSVVCNGRDITNRGVRAAERSGIRVIHQELSLFEPLSVYENVFSGHELTSPRTVPYVGRLDRQQMIAESDRVLNQQMGVGLDVTRPVSALSVGQKQLVEIARAVHTRAALVIMDEPTTSLESREKRVLREVIQKLTREGTSVLYISHDLDEVLSVCDEVVVLRDGRVVLNEPTRTSLTARDIVVAMTGKELGHQYPPPVRELGGTCLSVEGLEADGLAEPISFDVRAGEVFGIAGLAGSGKSALVRALAGLEPPMGGSVRLDGAPIDPRTPRRAISRGFVFVPSDRKLEGVFPMESATWNMTIGSLADLTRPRGVAIDGRREHEVSTRLQDRFKIRIDGADQRIENLSGGNQQKVILARSLEQRPTVLLMEEPTRGIDVAARRDIYVQIREFAAEGNCVVLVSSDDDELAGMCHEVLVMYGGRVRGLLEGDEITVEQMKYLIMTAPEAEVA
jgi:ABC-type sugar transport system ATPase subunit